MNMKNSKSMSKFITSILFILTIFIAGCTTNTQQTPQNNEDETQPGIEGSTDSTDTDVARRESEDVDKTQDQINNALTTLSESGSYMSPREENTI